MFDRFNRNISYLRISVTDRCNLRCIYCMPEGKIQRLPKDNILSLEEITEVVKTGAMLGIKKIRLTGGEPLVRKGIVNLVEMINNVTGIEEITMTTNGVLLPKFAHKLKQAGLNRINISLDSITPDIYEEITRGGNIENVFKGIQTAKDAGLNPIKINVVRLKNHPKQEIEKIKSFAAREQIQVRFISQMNLTKGEFSQVEGGDGGNCSICNRLRLLADGTIKPCLFSNEGYNIKEHGIKNAFLLALNSKPKNGIKNRSNSFYNIGG